MSEYGDDRQEIADAIAEHGAPATYVRLVINSDRTQFTASRRINVLVKAYKLAQIDGKAVRERDVLLIVPWMPSDKPRSGDTFDLGGGSLNVVNVENVTAPEGTILCHKVQLRAPGND